MNMACIPNLIGTGNGTDEARDGGGACKGVLGSIQSPCDVIRVNNYLDVMNHEDR